MMKLKLFIMFITFSFVKAPYPGNMLWKPRVHLDLTMPKRVAKVKGYLPTKENMQAGLVILIDGYQVGKAVIALAAVIPRSKDDPYLNPFSAYFYTNAYRWGLRHLSLLPQWLGGKSYSNTLKLWKRRFFYMDRFVPKWMKFLLPFVDEEEWVKEEDEHKKFQMYAEPTFRKHYGYPRDFVNDFKSQESNEMVESSTISGFSSESKSSESKSSDSKSSESKPSESKPSESKSSESKSAESEPQ